MYLVLAEVAELADAHGSGPCDSNIMRVQVPFPAFVFNEMLFYFVRSVLFILIMIWEKIIKSLKK